jgi:hypothetical protein
MLHMLRRCAGSYVATRPNPAVVVVTSTRSQVSNRGPAEGTNVADDDERDAPQASPQDKGTIKDKGRQVVAGDTAAMLLSAVRDRNLHVAQSVLAQHWRDQYAVYVLCSVLAMVVYYTTTSSMRHTQRRCEAATHRCQEELDILRDSMRSTMERWGREMIQRDEQMVDIQRQNMTMTRSVDQMAFALKQCAPWGFS